MSTANGNVEGHIPALLVRPNRKAVQDHERSKYVRMWENPDYRKFAPGAHHVNQFLAMARPSRGSSVIDFGCGTGEASVMLAAIGGLQVTALDFAHNCLNEDNAKIIDSQSTMNFVEADLTKPIPVSAKYGYCTDVMEHIPPALVSETLANILKAAQHCFFAISTVPDHFGSTIGEPLHLTVEPHSWWSAQFRKHDAVIHWSQNTSSVSFFYVTAWSNASELVKRGTLNTTNEQIAENVLANLKYAKTHGVQYCRPADRTDREVILLGGGPSLNKFKDQILSQRNNDKFALVTTNGSYNWAIENGMRPSAQIIVDSREFNARFLSPYIDDCRYLLSSQVDPALLPLVPVENLFIWHSALSDDLCDVMDKELSEWYPVPGGSTVMLRAFCLMRMLGYWKFHVYGFDSCLEGDTHHAYEQPENHDERIVTVSCGNRTFRCHPWMASQAQEFIDQIKLLGDEVTMEIYGDGLIAHIVKTGALPDASDFS